MKNSYTLEYKWTISHGRDTYGYNICTLRVDGIKVAACNGGGYDMEGTVLGDWVAKAFKEELLHIFDQYKKHNHGITPDGMNRDGCPACNPEHNIWKRGFYGLTFHDPDYDPGKAVIDGKTVEKREEEGLSLGLERYQQFYSASSNVPTERHKVPLIDGACGKEEVVKVLRAIGYDLESVHSTKNLTIERVYKKGDEND